MHGQQNIKKELWGEFI